MHGYGSSKTLTNSVAQLLSHKYCLQVEEARAKINYNSKGKKKGPYARREGIAPLTFKLGR
jgi:hypothetical protein